MSTLSQEYGTFEEFNLGVQTGLIAGPVNDQLNAVIIVKKWSEVSTNPIDYGSAKISPAKQGAEYIVFNDTDFILSVFPTSGESINGIIDYQFNIAPRSPMVFRCHKNGKLFSSGNSI